MKVQFKRFIKKSRVGHYFQVLAVLGFTTWSILVLYTMSIHSNQYATSAWVNQVRVKRPETVESDARFNSPLFAAESERKSLRQKETDEVIDRKQLSPTVIQSRSFRHKTTLITTKVCLQHYFLLILVSSAPAYIQRRSDIRQTWGTDTSIEPQWKTVFLVAQTRVQSESNALFKEDELFGDLIRADYYDHYSNQSLKIRMGFEWAARYCKFSFLLKMDDDTFANTKALVSFLKLPSTPREKLYLGRDANTAVLRGGKFGVSKQEYSGNRYPPFCPGFGVVFSNDVILLFVDLFDVVSKFRLDDVYMGMLADKAGVKPSRTSNFEFSVNPPPTSKCKWQKSTLLRHGITGDCLFQLFNETVHRVINE